MGLHGDQPGGDCAERQEEHPLFLPVGGRKHSVAWVRRRVGSVQPRCAGHRPPRVRHLGDICVERKPPI